MSDRHLHRARIARPRPALAHVSYLPRCIRPHQPRARHSSRALGFAARDHPGAKSAIRKKRHQRPLLLHAHTRIAAYSRASAGMDAVTDEGMCVCALVPRPRSKQGARTIAGCGVWASLVHWQPSTPLPPLTPADSTTASQTLVLQVQGSGKVEEVVGAPHRSACVQVKLDTRTHPGAGSRHPGAHCRHPRTKQAETETETQTETDEKKEWHKEEDSVLARRRKKDTISKGDTRLGCADFEAPGALNVAIHPGILFFNGTIRPSMETRRTVAVT